jgi:hypothetical protein
MYDFRSLSSHDFEILVRDLLQMEFGKRLESFKPGRDKGIDLRHSSAEDGSLIIHCKHYVGTGYAGLLTSLKKEVLKVKKLAPARYCVATSVPLSPANKQEIKELFEPYCKNQSDVFGTEDLNNLLTKFPNIEKQNFKLWLTSTTLLERILHNGLYNQTSVLVEGIQGKAKNYVQNESFFDAQEILKTNNYCIISGIPGIGKTFLAEILLVHYISNGYQPVVVRSHIGEAFEMLKPSEKQVFYYDDFLGQTGWEDKLQKNEEQSILDFIKYVKAHNNFRFILTTREYILQQARLMYEKLHASDFDHAKCIVKLESYTRHDKAHILFNHIYFSNLPDDHKFNLAQKENLLAIVDHKNYSPRIVEWMSDHKNVRDYTSVEYPKQFKITLENPSELWRHAFRNHLSPYSRSMLIVLMTFRYTADLSDLKESFEEFRNHEVRHFGGSYAPTEFNSALNELEGSFIRCERNQQDVVVAFHNPSVLDFLEKYLSENAELLCILCSSIVFYDQFLALCSLRSGKSEHEHISAILSENPTLLCESIKNGVMRTAKKRQLYKTTTGYALSPLVQTSVEENIAHALGVAGHFPETHRENVVRHLLGAETSRVVDGTGNLREVIKTIEASFALEGIDAMRSELIKATAKKFEDETMGYDELDDIVALCYFIESVPEAVSNHLIDRVKLQLEQDADLIFDWDISSADDEHSISQLREDVSRIEEAFNVELTSVTERLDEREEEIRYNDEEPPDDWDERRDSRSSDASDLDILAMFEGLKE